MKNMKLLAKTFAGLESVLAAELGEMGAQNITILKRAVGFEGTKELMYKANLCLRTAIKVLLPIYTFRFRNNQEYYNRVQDIDWNIYLNEKKTFAIDAVVNSKLFSHSGFVALKTKDAIVDQIREQRGLRPSVDPVQPDLLINVHIYEDTCTISLDSSGDPLFKRGYRIDQNEAPINEALAAGMIFLSGWDKKTTLIDPMCGSGTILIEAAYIALNYPPCLNREIFGFFTWKDYDNTLWLKVVEDATRSIKTSLPEIFGSDIDHKAIRITKNNLKKAKLDGRVTVKQLPFEEFVPPETDGIVIMNPPYGERLEKDEINSFYGMMGSRFKHIFLGYSIWLISSNNEAIKHIGLRPEKKIPLFNGGLECKYLGYKVFGGKLKDNQR